MIRRSFRIGLSLGLLTGLVLALTKALQHRRRVTPAPAGSGGPWEPLAPVTPAPAPVPGPTADTRPEPEVDPERPLRVAGDVPRAAPPAAEKATQKATGKAAKKAATKASGATWVDPGDDGGCPASHPVKAKLSSRIFHLPGMLNYDRTNADRCYLDANAAEGDGLRAAKR